MANRRTARQVAAAAVLALTITACSSGDDTDPGDPSDPPAPTGTPTTSTAAPATAEPPSTEPAFSRDDAFTLAVPDGWQDVTSDYPEIDIEMALRDTEMTAEFYRNLVVARHEPIADLEQAIAEVAEQVTGEEGEVVELTEVDIAGHAAPGYTVVRITDGVEVHQSQWWLEHEDALYVVSTSAAAADADAASAVFAEVLDSWAWQTN